MSDLLRIPKLNPNNRSTSLIRHKFRGSSQIWSLMKFLGNSNCIFITVIVSHYVMHLHIVLFYPSLVTAWSALGYLFNKQTDRKPSGLGHAHFKFKSDDRCRISCYFLTCVARKLKLSQAQERATKLNLPAMVLRKEIVIYQELFCLFVFIICAIHINGIKCVGKNTNLLHEFTLLINQPSFLEINDCHGFNLLFAWIKKIFSLAGCLLEQEGMD